MTPGSLPIALLTLAVLAGCEGLDCPTGTVPRGAAPPEDWEQWCEGEDGRGRRSIPLFVFFSMAGNLRREINLVNRLDDA